MPKHYVWTLLALAGCGTGGTSEPSAAAPPLPSPPTQVAAPAQPAPAAAAAPAVPKVDLASVNACPFSAEVVSNVLGAAYGEGKELPPIPGVPTKSCTYEAKNASQLRLNITALSPAMAEAVRADLTMGLAGEKTRLSGDPDGAVFQMQSDMGTCALHYVRGTVQYEVRLMTCRGEPAKEQSKLTKLPRP